MDSILDTPCSLPFFYKYAPPDRLEWLEDLLLTHHLYVPTVTQLNDPVEGKPRLKLLSVEELTKFYVRDYLQRRGALDDAATLAKNVGLITRSTAHHGSRTIMRETAATLYKQLESTRIYSMSKRWNNLALWAKYAGNHTGDCLEFENSGIFTAAREVQYVSEVSLDINDAEQVNVQFFFRKTPDWSNEEEVRLWRPRDWSARLPFAPDLLKKVILGKSMKPDDRNAIREWSKLREPNVAVAEAEPCQPVR